MIKPFLHKRLQLHTIPYLCPLRIVCSIHPKHLPTDPYHLSFYVISDYCQMRRYYICTDKELCKNMYTEPFCGIIRRTYKRFPVPARNICFLASAADSTGTFRIFKLICDQSYFQKIFHESGIMPKTHPATI